MSHGAENYDAESRHTRATEKEGQQLWGLGVFTLGKHIHEKGGGRGLLE